MCPQPHPPTESLGAGAKQKRGQNTSTSYAKCGASSYAVRDLDWAHRTTFEIEVEHGRIIDLMWGSPLQLRASIRKRWPDVQAEAALDHKLEKVAETIGDYEPVEEFRNHVDGTRNRTAKNSAPINVTSRSLTSMISTEHVPLLALVR